MDEVSTVTIPTAEKTTAKVQERAKVEEERGNVVTQLVEAGADRVTQKVHP